MASIRQNSQPQALPDFRNLGVVLRTVLLVNGFAVLAGLARNGEWSRLPQELVELAALVEPPLIGALVLLYALQPVIKRTPPVLAWILVAGIAAALAASFHLALPGGEPAAGMPERAVRGLIWSALAALLVLSYFHLRSRAFSPAVAEARLMALTARIRPHFLFNSLNAVLGVIRSDPRRAEAALEELSDLFRVLMQENRELSTLGEEIGLCRQYLDLERLRLGSRLAVKWHLERCPDDAQVPPLMLQPLLENAVYHGIEPAATTGEIAISIARRGDQIEIELANPYHGEGGHAPGNRMALDNIRERLMLFFDLEARLDTSISKGEYRVMIRLPYRTRGS
jgi:two-component system, LytTR family, sensor histidine kinase AlgZ